VLLKNLMGWSRVQNPRVCKTPVGYVSTLDRPGAASNIVRPRDTIVGVRPLPGT
jgi:hypothetical protein